jgi:hypothetical protein
MEITLPPDITKLLEVWDQSSTKYLYAGYFLVMASLLCSLGVTIFADHLSKLQIKVLGFVAAAGTGLVAAFHPIDAGNAFRDAWRGLNLASIEYKLSKEHDYKKLVTAVLEGEQIIARVQGKIQPDTTEIT